MITERLQRLIAEIAALPPEEQVWVAAAALSALRQPPVASDTVRSEVMAAFERAIYSRAGY